MEEKPDLRVMNAKLVEIPQEVLDERTVDLMNCDHVIITMRGESRD